MSCWRLCSEERLNWVWWRFSSHAERLLPRQWQTLKHSTVTNKQRLSSLTPQGLEAALPRSDGNRKHIVWISFGNKLLTFHVWLINLSVEMSLYSPSFHLFCSLSLSLSCPFSPFILIFEASYTPSIPYHFETDIIFFLNWFQFSKLTGTWENVRWSQDDHGPSVDFACIREVRFLSQGQCNLLSLSLTFTCHTHTNLKHRCVPGIVSFPV